MKVSIDSTHFKSDQKLTEFIEKKLTKLDTYFDKIIDIHVILKFENSAQVKEKVVEVIVNVPGDALIAKVKNKAFEAGVDEACDSLKRQLVKHKEKQKQYI